MDITFKTNTFLGKITYIPNNPDKLLICYYGNDYIKSDTVCDENCENCVKTHF